MKSRNQAYCCAALLLAAILLLSLASCGGGGANDGKPSPEPTPERTPEPTLEPAPEPTPDPVADALAQYRVIAGQAASYDYGADDPTGDYRYALVRMRTGYEVPALLLEQDTEFGISYVLVFQYEPDNGQVIRADGIMAEGVGSAGGYRGGLSAAGDGNGILSTEFSSGTGMGSTSRITLNGNSLRTDVLWEGNIFDPDPTGDEIGFLDIGWHDIADLSGLDSWTPGADATASPPKPAKPSGPETLPTDGDRIVFTGTIGTYTYDEVLALQGEEDPDPGPYNIEREFTFRLIVLDEPRTMRLMSGSGDGSREGTVSMIDVSSADGIEQYDGQHLIFSIDPSRTWWPSDVSLPLGEPRTSDVHVLS